MKENELMIGDWIYNNNFPRRVTAINGSLVSMGSGSCKDIKHLDPILLTPEILEKNGFKKFGFLNIEGQHQWSWWLDTLTSVTLWCRELKDDTKDGWMIRIESPLATCCLKVEYVHELQHALRLSGIEKKIEL